MTDGEGGTTEMRYTAAGHLLEIEDANDHVRAMEVDARGQVRVTRDAQGRAVASHEYDADGNRTKTTDFDGGETVFVYDKLGRLTSTTDALGHTSRQQYDAEGRVIARIDARGSPDGDALRPAGAADGGEGPGRQRDADGVLRGAVAAGVRDRGRATATRPRCWRTSSGRVVGQEDPLGNPTATSYDPNGRRDQVQDPAGHITRFGYDAAGRLTGVTDAREGLTQYGYDPRGNRVTVTDANQKVTAVQRTTWPTACASRRPRSARRRNTATTWRATGPRRSTARGS